jgi:uncharacterized protein (TIGR02996 family)
VFPEDALLKAVIAEPEDDAPRLIYADWLEENGQEARAEFIRVQVALARMKEESRDHRDLRARAGELLRMYDIIWAGPFRKATAYWGYVRGFILGTTCDLRSFGNHAEALFRHAPIQRLYLRKARGVVAQFVSVPELIRIDTISLAYERMNDDDAHALARCPYLKCLNHLMLSGNAIGDSGARALASSPYLDSLDILDLGNNPPLTPSGQAALRRRFGERVRF